MHTCSIIGSAGILTVDASSGLIVNRPERLCDLNGAVDAEYIGTRDECVSAFGNAACDYDDIARLDVDEWRKAYPGAKLEGATHDILDFGFWNTAGAYEPPAVDWRGMVREM